jgi:hypothetical protein
LRSEDLVLAIHELKLVGTKRSDYASFRVSRSFHPPTAFPKSRTHPSENEKGESPAATPTDGTVGNVFLRGRRKRKLASLSFAREHRREPKTKKKKSRGIADI